MGDITTPARRMTRAINALENAPRTWVLSFDADGYEIARREPQSLSDCPGSAREHAAGQGRRVAERKIQDDIDTDVAFADFINTATPEELKAAGYGD